MTENGTEFIDNVSHVDFHRANPEIDSAEVGRARIALAEVYETNATKEETMESVVLRYGEYLEMVRKIEMDDTEQVA
jgi:hypothetical protein